MDRKKTTMTKRPIESYQHRDKQRINNPPVGLVTPDTDPDAGAKRTYAYDPHLDPQLQWAGKAEHTSFEVPTVSLHVHERIDPRTIIEAVKRRNGDGPVQGSLFEAERQEPLRQAVEFYKHAHGWSNRLIAGDSLLVMNSLLEKEGLAGKVQMVYLDPPYGIRYGSNFQPFVNQRDVKDGRDEDLTAEPEQIRAFRDTWELGIHSYLTYLRDRLLLARELLAESGSIFAQISDENVHHVRELMDEVFGAGNFVSVISFATTSGFQSTALARAGDYLVWYARDVKLLKFRQQFVPAQRNAGEGTYRWLHLPDGTTRAMRKGEIEGSESLPEGTRLYKPDNTISQGAAGEPQPFDFRGKTYLPPSNSHWKANYPEGMERLAAADRLHVAKNSLQYIRYADDFPWQALNNMWVDTLTGQFTESKIFVVQTNAKVIQRCLLMTTDPGDLVFDPTCGSGTTAYVAEQWGRRWITCDTSRVALTLAKQRLMTAVFDYYELAHPSEGVGSGFRYRTVPHVTLKSIANNPDIREGMTREQIDAAIARHAPQETLYDQPFVDRKKTRVSGPFTVEAVPAPAVKSVDDLLEGPPPPADASIARSGETLRQAEWRDELLRAGIRGKAGQQIRFARLEPLPGCRWLHADGESRPNDAGADGVREVGAASVAQRIVVSFGPEHAPLEQRQVAQALEEAQTLVPKPKIIVFAAFQFDPEAAKDIDETNWPGVTLLKAQMNADLLTDDLKKKRASNESFWLIGQPDVRVERVTEGPDRGKLRVSVHGFDYYNTKTGGIESGGEDHIAVWLLDTDYDGRSLYPRQVFFPMAGAKDGWARLARNLKAEIDQELIEAYRGTVSLPFEPGEHRRLAVKIVDDRGIESLKVVGLE
jgi:adenine-specific DNA-methyltransferase